MTLTVVLVLGAAATQSVQAQRFTVLHTFKGPPDGSAPDGLIRDAVGNLFGTTQFGGLYNGGGTVFKVTKAGKETVLHNFCSGYNCSDGEHPEGGLTWDTSGNLCGTTIYGGASDNGVIFEVDAAGQESVLYNFTGGLDGDQPEAKVIEDTQGNLYGTTTLGGSTDCSGYGCGTVFELSGTGEENLLYSFVGPPDGAKPFGALVRDATGNLYGTTFYGGLQDEGTVFKVSQTGEETTLYSFCSQNGCTDGASPFGGLVRDADGNLYGTTYLGGNGTCTYGGQGCGSVFKVDKTGTETVLYSFNGGSDGAHPHRRLLLDEAGNLYGTTYGNAASNFGTVFKVTKGGKETTLYSFCSRKHCSDGAYPYGVLIRDSKGNLYGTAEEGGSGYGTVWKLTP